MSLENSLIARFGDDLWSKRCQELEQVVRFIEDGDGQLSDGSNQWVGFIKFLQQNCAGKYFSNDKQWSQLLNLMQISRKLNHRTVKFKDILKNRMQIEKAAERIEQLNESAKLSDVICQLLEDLDTNLAKIKLKLIPLKTGSDDKVASKPMLGSKLVQQIDELSTSRRNLRERCWLLVGTIRIELRNPLLANNIDQLDEWRCKIDTFETDLRILDEFLNRFEMFLSETVQLEPLIGKNLNNSQTDDSAQINKSVSSVVDEFSSLMCFAYELTDVLIKTSKSAKSISAGKAFELQLMKLIKTRKHELIDNILDSRLATSINRINSCKQTINEITKTLRLEFARFYFVNDSQLLQIIALDANLVADSQAPVNKALIRKLFNNSIDSFVLDNSDATKSNFVTGVRSTCGEVVFFDESEKPVAIRKRINVYSLQVVRIFEECIRKLQRSLCKMLEKSLKKSLSQDSIDYIDWNLPIQLIDIAEQVKFCRRVEICIRQQNRRRIELETLQKGYRSQMSKLKLEEFQPSDDDQIKVMKLSVVVSLNIYFVTTIAKLISLSNQLDDLSWAWFKCTRYYLREATKAENWTIEVHIDGICFEYKFNYLAQEQLESINSKIQDNNNEQSKTTRASFGTYKRLIVTKTSERCFLVASQAIGRLKLGISPYGPAGSGKTETMKALGRQLGCQVIVHNCDENNDSISLNRLVWGLAHTGLWCCFDEFNRLSKSTLSSVSATLERVQNGLRESKLTIIDGAGDMMSIDPNAAFFITLNPVSPNNCLKEQQRKLYKGRRRLPANIRSLFVPVPMVQVQIDTIVSETLMDISLRASACGNQRFSSLLEPAKSIEIGHKVQAWINDIQTSTLNSCDNRCEWDLRLVIAILRRFEIQLTSLSCLDLGEQNDGCDSIVKLFRNSMDLEIVPRLSSHEQSILKSSFESVGLNDFDETQELYRPDEIILKLRSKIRKTLNSIGLTTRVSEAENFALQLFNQLETHTGVVLVGARKSGKTTTWKTLSQSVSAIDRSIKWFALSPKSCSKPTLFGVFEQNTRKWTDGILTRTIRTAINFLTDQQREDKFDQVWIVLDGHIDPEWIECLNSVLDDNRILTLASGERLDFCPAPKKFIKLIFETTSMKDASPATISRLGLVYIEPNDELFQVKSETKIISKQQDLVDLLLKDQTSKIFLLVCSDDLISQDLSKTLAQTFKDRKLYKYSCSALTCANNLIDLLSGIPADESVDIVLENVHLILAEDEWQNVSFLELLRFMIDYNIYYDKELHPRTLNSRTRLMLTTVGTDNINDRLSSSAHIIRLNYGNTFGKKLELIEDVGLILNENSQPGQYFSPISTILGINTRTVNDLVESINTSKKEVFRFNNSDEVGRAMSKLDELVSFQNLYKNSNKLTIFIFEELASRLLSREILQKLYHLLNLLNNRSGVGEFKFLYLCNSKDEERGNFCWTFWSSIGSVRKLKLESPLSGKLYLRQQLRSMEIGQPDFEWAAEKLDILIRDDSLRIKLDNIGLTCKLSRIFQRKFNETVSCQRKIYSNGLKSLKNLENGINRLQDNQEISKQVLASKKQEIEKFIAALDTKLKEAQSRNEKIDGFRDVQERKTMDISKKKLSIEANMTQVRAKIEASKTEIDKCLRPEALNEIKSLRSPPKTVKDILDVLFVLLGEKELCWSSMKSYLTRYYLRDELTKYDFHNNLNSNLLQDVELLIRERQDSFSIQQATRASAAIVPIVKWIHATVEYGKVMIKLKPLNNELLELQRESNEIDHKITRYKQEQQNLEAQIATDTQKLVSLKAEHKNFKNNCKIINSELDKMKQILSNLGSQTSRWREKLQSIDELYDEKELIKLSMLTATALVCAYSNNGIEYNLYDRVIELSNLLEIESKPIETIQKLIDLSTRGISSIDTEGFSTGSRCSLEDLLQLFLIRVSLTITKYTELELFPLIPFYHSTTKTKDEIIEYLSYQNIVCGREELVYVDFDTKFDADPREKSTNDSMWLNSIRLGFQLNKVLVIDVSRLCETGEDLLNMMDSIVDSNKDKRIGPKNFGASGVVFVGHWNIPTKFASLDHYVLRLPFFNGALKKSNTERISEEIVADRLVRCNNAVLSQSNYQLLEEYRSKKANSRLMESMLLEKITEAETHEMFFSENNEIKSSEIEAIFRKSNLINILNELHLVSVELQTYRIRWQTSQDNLEAKRKDYIQLSRRAAKFFDHCLANLSSMDTFYDVSMKRYIELLLVGSKTKSASIDFEEILVEALRPMRSKARKDFIQNLLDSREMVELITDEPDTEKAKNLANAMINSALRRASNLSTVLSSTLDSLSSSIMLNDCCLDEGKIASPLNNSIKLMVVQHDATKASPQLEVDAFFCGANAQLDSSCHRDDSSQQTNAKIEYTKLYAAGEQSDQLKGLEMEITKSVSASTISSSQSNSIRMPIDKHDSTSRICCICITNAHLAPYWITNKLLACVQASLANRIRKQVKVLLILISENSNDGSYDTCTIGLKKSITLAEDSTNNSNLDALYRRADIKYWHDELALNFANRYNLFMNVIGRQLLSRLEQRIIAEHNCKSSMQGELISMDQVEDLVRRVVLLHTSCQQLTLATQVDSNRFGWKRDYNFDFELLCFALGVFEHLVRSQLSDQSNRYANLTGCQDKCIVTNRVGLRYRLCKYLNEVVYGATHLETNDDEELFLRLSNRLFNLSSKQIEKFLEPESRLTYASSSSIEQGLIDILESPEN